MSKDPTITVLEYDQEMRTARLRIEGGILAEGWAPRPGHAAWCNMVVHLSEDGESGGVRSFGGEVWPAAWPHLFAVGPRTKDGQAINLTDEGVMMANAAIYGLCGGFHG